MTTIEVCPLCAREHIPKTSAHHFIPKSRGGTKKEPLCLDCHSSIHRFFTNKELETTYNTVEALLSHPEFAKHIDWLKKRDPARRYKTKRTRRRRGI